LIIDAELSMPPYAAADITPLIIDYYAMPAAYACQADSLAAFISHLMTFTL